MQIHIQKVKSTDLETILQLQKNCYISEAKIYNDFTIQPLQQDLQSLQDEFETSTILKAVINGEIVGSVRGYIENQTAYIGKLIVSEKFQNKGLGSMLLQAIESGLHNCNRYELFTGNKSEKNLYLYKRHGYEEFKQQIINENITLIYLEKK